MRKRLTIGVAATALAATVSLVAAGSYGRDRATARHALPANEIFTTVRLLGLEPTTSAFRQGPYYVLHAVDPRGAQLRVVADAELGDVVSITPLFLPRFDAGPRIIHVPQPGEHGSTDDRNEAELPNDAIEQSAPPSRHGEIRRPYHRSEQRSAPSRNVLSAPPPPAEGLSPAHPTPKIGAKNEAEKFRAPEEQADSSRLPPPGPTPPAVLPAQK